MTHIPGCCAQHIGNPHVSQTDFGQALLQEVRIYGRQRRRRRHWYNVFAPDTLDATTLHKAESYACTLTDCPPKHRQVHGKSQNHSICVPRGYVNLLVRPGDLLAGELLVPRQTLFTNGIVANLSLPSNSVTVSLTSHLTRAYSGYMRATWTELS
jgi:hypothetical protein